ncbi:MAG: hypothetical protein ACFCVE_08570 [Phycisphaerae bacterium]
MIPPLAVIILLIVVALTLAWLVSEFGKSRRLRVVLGLAAIASAMGLAYLVGHLSRLSYNAWYGGASHDLINTVVTEIEDGNIDRVMSVLRGLDLHYQPTYEHRAHYDELVNKAVSQMKGRDALPPEWDAPPFTRQAWLGHWENDTGFWIVVNETSGFNVVRSGDGMPKMSHVVLSDDSATLAFTEGDRWRHELTLNNKYEATHVWRDLADNSVWQTDTLHKLRRTAPEQRASTQRKE